MFSIKTQRVGVTELIIDSIGITFLDVSSTDRLVELFPISKYATCGIDEMNKVGSRLDYLIPYIEQYIGYLQRCSGVNEVEYQQQLGD